MDDDRNGLSAPFGVDWDTNLGLDGRYNLRVIVTDVAGNSSTSSTVTNRKVQNLPPFIDITSPGNYINAASPSPFTITVTTEALQFGVDHVEFFRCTDASVNCSTGTFASIGVDFTDPYTGSWAQASEPEGNRALNALVVDGDGGTGADVFNVIIDRTAPTGSVTAPGSGAYVGGTTVAVSSTRRTRCQASRRWSSSARRPVSGVDAARHRHHQPVFARLEHDIALGRGFRLARGHDRHGGQLVQRPGDDGQRRQHGPDGDPGRPGCEPARDVNLTGSASDTAGSPRSSSSARPPEPARGPRSTPTRPRRTRRASTRPRSATASTTSARRHRHAGNVTNSATVANRRVDNTAPDRDPGRPGREPARERDADRLGLGHRR